MLVFLHIGDSNMKKLASIAIILLVITISVFAIDTNVSKLSLDDLSQLYTSVLSELRHRATEVKTSPTTSKVIKFRNFEWGTSYKDFKVAMSAEKIRNGISTAGCIDSWESKLTSYGNNPITSDIDYGYWFWAYSVKDVKVAGFNVSEIHAKFLLKHDRYTVDESEDNAQLYKAQYIFQVADGQAAYEVLAGKLTALYGEGVHQSNSSSWISTYLDTHKYIDVITWYGADDTGVYLCYSRDVVNETSAISNETLSLCYGKSNSLKLIEELIAVKSSEEIRNSISSNDLSGL